MLTACREKHAARRRLLSGALFDRVREGYDKNRRSRFANSYR